MYKRPGAIVTDHRTVGDMHLRHLIRHTTYATLTAIYFDLKKSARGGPADGVG
jgi:hypothetical protein